jgi:hypothetical protein
LADSDFVVAGIKVGADSSEVSKVLGPPTSVDAHNDSWHYDGLDVCFAKSATVRYFALVGHHYKTHRALRVGDPIDRIKKFYGKPYKQEFTFFRYRRADDPSLGIAIEAPDDVVTAIYVGQISAMPGAAPI